VEASERDPQRLFKPEDRRVKLDEQGGACANCGNPTQIVDSRGHHYPVRHADGGRTVPSNHVEVCTACHGYLHGRASI
jgi:hypothetical protein